jgi:hypothetical protein
MFLLLYRKRLPHEKGLVINLREWKDIREECYLIMDSIEMRIEFVDDYIDDKMILHYRNAGK